jgi:hypothetical protein
MSKIVRKDTWGSESLMPVLIFVAVFMSICVTLIMAFQGFFYDVETNAAYDGKTDAQDLETGIPSVYCTPVEGYTVTADMTIEQITATMGDYERDHDYIFTDEDTEASDPDLHVNVVENNVLFGGDWYSPSDGDRSIYEDFFWIWQKYGWWGIRHAVISYETVIDNAGDTNISYTAFVLGEYSYSLVVTMPANVTGDTFTLYMFFGEYNIKIGSLPFSGWSDYGNQTVWGTLKQMMTMDLPDTHPIIDFLIAVPIWTALAFTFFTIVSRLIPLVSGG